MDQFDFYRILSLVGGDSRVSMCSQVRQAANQQNQNIVPTFAAELERGTGVLLPTVLRYHGWMDGHGQGNQWPTPEVVIANQCSPLNSAKLNMTAASVLLALVTS